MKKSDFKNQPFKQRLGFALSGIRHIWQEEKSFQTQLILGGGAIAVFFVVGISLLWWALIILCVGLVLAAEILNSSIEALIDHLHPDQHTRIGSVKDMMAGMVLVLSAVAGLVACMALIDRFFL